ncbi:hypothetical protein Poly24_19030 [Rosistilla carotiformis]|uniref:Uncharacterized protein n=1 Tax=Rosistilla carotiformis TaxID=2528017 RepID=A0A518JRM3_9BACT|nr:hypothetical protein [Rosistilla carotiformis]QDV68194.1 hypothetical protein Poly24_19030 [Rosistilla carotiformis]
MIAAFCVPPRLLQATLVGIALVTFAASLASAQEPLPPDDPTRVKYRQIFIPKRDETKLIPPDYEPISRSELKRALSNLQGSSDDKTVVPELVQLQLMARYSENALQSIGTSFLEFQYQDDAPGKVSLSPLNLAVLPTASFAGSTTARLSTSLDGQATARVSGDERIEFAWSLQGQSIAAGTRFSMRLPATGTGKVYLALPKGFEIETQAGAIQPVDSASSVRDNLLLRDDEDFFLLELGGSNLIEFSIVKTTSSPVLSEVVMREAFGKYQIREDSVGWDFTFDFTWPRENGPLTLQLPNGSAPTSLIVDSMARPYETTTDNGQTLISLNPSDWTDVTSSIDHRLQIVGLSAPLKSGWVTLPKISWRNSQVVMSGSGSMLRLDLSYPIELIDVDTSTRWTIENSSRTDVEESYQFSGASWDAPLQLFLQRDDSQATATNALRMNIGSDSLQATWDSFVEYKVAMLPAEDDQEPALRLPTIGPISLEIEDGWEITSAVVVSSGREVERVGGKIDRLTIWPEPDEVNGKVFHVRVKGRRPLPPQDRVSIPPIFFVRWETIPTSEYVMLSASSRIQFRSNQGLQQNRISNKQLPTIVAELFGDPNTAQCYLAIDSTRMPSIEFDRPASRFDARVDVSATFHDGRITEQFTIGIENVSGKLEDLVVRFPESRQEPIRWSVADTARNHDDATGRKSILAKRQSTEDGAEVWQLRAHDRFDDGTVIVGTREIGEAELRIDLPSIPLAFNQRGIVRTDRSVEVVSVSPNIVRIPEPKRIQTEVPLPVLRYDPTVDGQVTVQARKNKASLPIIQQQQITVVADASGAERIFVEINPDSSGLIIVQHEPALRLERAIGEQSELPTEAVRVSESAVTCKLATQRSLLLVFTVNRAAQVWGRVWQPPRVQCQNAVLQSSLRLLLGPDSVDIHRDVWRRDNQFPQDEPPAYVIESVSVPLTSAAASLEARSPMILLRSETMTGLQFGAAILLVAFGWATAQWRIFGILGSAFLLICLLGVLADWQINWMLLPLLPYAIGALIASLLECRSVARIEEDAAGETGSRSLVMRVLIGWALIVCWAVAANAQTPPITHSLLIPTDDGGAPSDKVYIPPTLYQQLLQRESKAFQLSNAHVSSARYIVDIRSNAFVAERDAARVQATIGIENPELANSVVLAIRQQPFRQAIRRIDLLVAGDVIAIRRPALGDDKIILQLNGQPSATVRFSLSVPTQIDEATGRRELLLEIPPVLNSQLAVMYDDEVRDVEAVSSLGVVVANAATQSLSADLGPVENLQVVWRKQNAAPTVPLVNTRRCWYLHLTPQQVAREVQLDFVQPADGSTVDRVELNFDTTSIPVVTSAGWRLEASRLLEGERTALTFVSTGDTNEGLRLLWSSSRDGELSQTIRLVDIRSAATEEHSPEVLVAIAAPANWTIEDPFESLATVVDANAFLSHWPTRTGPLSKVFRSEYKGPIPFRLRKNDVRHALADDLHQINFETDRLDINYKVSVQDYATAGESIRLRVPKNLQIESSILQGESVPHKRLPFDDHDEIVIRWRANPDPFVELYVKASVAVKLDVPLSVPRIFPSQFTLTSSEYQWSRVSDVALEWLKQEAFEDLRFDVTGVEQLHAQMFPVTRWNLDVQWLSEPVLPGEFRLQKVTPRIESESVTVVSWKDRAWSAKAYFDIHVQQGNIDYFSFEVPASWFGEVSIDDDLPWIAMPSVNRDSKIILVLPSRQAANRYRITIRGGPRATASESVTVPTVRILETGKHRHFFAVPRRLTNEAIAWKVTSANEITLRTPLARASGVPDDHVTYEANPNFSASLNPVLDLTIEPLVSLASFEYFETAIAAHVRCKWDFVPAGRDLLSVQIPEEYKVVAARINDMEADLHRRPAGVLDVQLLYSQLPQQIELLVEVPRRSDPKFAELRMPKVVGVPVKETWFVVQATAGGGAFQRTPQETVAPSGWDVVTAQERLQAQAESIITCLDNATESLQERTSYELVHWLTPWLNRFEDAVESLATYGTAVEPTIEDLRTRMDQLVEQAGVETLVRQALEPAAKIAYSPEQEGGVYHAEGQQDQILITFHAAEDFNQFAPLAQAAAIWSGLFLLLAAITYGLRVRDPSLGNLIWIAMLGLGVYTFCPRPWANVLLVVLAGIAILAVLMIFRRGRVVSV